MKTESFSSEGRELRELYLTADLIVVGGGIAGTCTAISAAREGLKVILVQDRPVLGGNGSSEVRLWWLGATGHGYTNNRWAREAGIVNELLLENLYQNPEGNPELVDVILLDAVKREPKITLLLNTAVDHVEKSSPDRIRSVSAVCSQNSTRYRLEAQMFCDASGDGVVGFLSGAAFRMGAEASEEFGEALAPDDSFGELLGDTIYFYTRDAGRPVPFIAPSFADAVTPSEFRMMKYFNLGQHGCQLWWIETGGRRDTVHDTEQIKWDLWQVVYGIWDYIKNSGEYPDSENLTLEWVGKIPGKREARRFEGDTWLTQQDVVHARPKEDAVGFGGWSIDLHPADGLRSRLPSAIQYHFRGLYPIPYRCLYSRNIRNLFLGGRTLSSSHVAFGSVRVMCTLGMLGEAIGVAASLACRGSGEASDVPVNILQRTLLRRGFHLPRVERADEEDLAQQAYVKASTVWSPRSLQAGEGWLKLEKHQNQILPLSAGPLPAVQLNVRSTGDTLMTAEWRVPTREESQTPDRLLALTECEVNRGTSCITLEWQGDLPEEGFAYLILRRNPEIEVALSDLRATGLLRTTGLQEQRKGDSHQQYIPAEEAGCEAFAFWCSDERRPLGKNLAVTLSRPLSGYGPEEVLTQPLRPVMRPNAWVADPADPEPCLTLHWHEPQAIRRVRIFLDPDWDHPVETVLKRHADRVMPCLVRDLDLTTPGDGVIAVVRENRAAVIELSFPEAVKTDEISLHIRAMNGPWPAAVFGVRVYE